MLLSRPSVPRQLTTRKSWWSTKLASGREGEVAEFFSDPTAAPASEVRPLLYAPVRFVKLPAHCRRFLAQAPATCQPMPAGKKEARLSIKLWRRETPVKNLTAEWRRFR
jgi:hypothetical protein